MTRYVLGVDGGSTKTQAAVVTDDGRLCGVGWGVSSNIDDTGIEATTANIAQAVGAARTSAELPPDTPFDAAFLGLAGIVSDQDRAIVQNIAQRLKLSARVGVDHDCRIALAGGLVGKPGIVLIAGTGSSCFGMNESGERWRAGGWGHLFADEGSSYWLGVNALRLAVGTFDGRWNSILSESVPKYLGLADINDIMHRVYVEGLSKAQIAALAPLVTDAARQSDAAALDLIEQGMRELARCVRAVAYHLGWKDRPCEVTLAGGLFRAGDIILKPLQRALADQLPACVVVQPRLPPVLGACILGLQMLGIPLDAAVEAALREGVKSIVTNE